MSQGDEVVEVAVKSIHKQVEERGVATPKELSHQFEGACRAARVALLKPAGGGNVMEMVCIQEVET